MTGPGGTRTVGQGGIAQYRRAGESGSLAAVQQESLGDAYQLAQSHGRHEAERAPATNAFEANGPSGAVLL
jgi:hypothetical protein